MVIVEQDLNPVQRTNKLFINSKISKSFSSIHAVGNQIHISVLYNYYDFKMCESLISELNYTHFDV